MPACTAALAHRQVPCECTPMRRTAVADPETGTTVLRLLAPSRPDVRGADHGSWRPAPCRLHVAPRTSVCDDQGQAIHMDAWQPDGSACSRLTERAKVGNCIALEETSETRLGVFGLRMALADAGGQPVRLGGRKALTALVVERLGGSSTGSAFGTFRSHVRCVSRTGRRLAVAANTAPSEQMIALGHRQFLPRSILP